MSNIQSRIDAVRRFNRFYTKKIGVLQEGLLQSPFSLTEVRVLYEPAHREKAIASDIAAELGLDAGYLSRILHGFVRRKLISKTPSTNDGRESVLALTRRGQEAFTALNASSDEEIGALLHDLSSAKQARLVESMSAIEDLFGEPVEPKTPYILRSPQPGDMGWVIHRHGVLYSQEYGWGERFEALVADIVAKFMEKHDPERERCWIAERDLAPVGSVFLVKKTATVAKLRLLLVEPAARGLGIGGRLVDECARFAHQAGYRKIILWTNSNLYAARRLYAAAGYRLVNEEPNDLFGKNLVAETWELKLATVNRSANGVQ